MVKRKSPRKSPHKSPRKSPRRGTTSRTPNKGTRTPKKGTKGWKADSPKKGTARHEMVQKCPNCFLLPNEEKFPVCKSDCKVDCRGITSAKIRAKQYGYTNVYNKAAEDCILWNDTDLAIDWKLETPLLSEKDLQGKQFKNFVSLF